MGQVFRINSHAAVKERLKSVKELLRTNDVVLISYIEALLADSEIRAFVLDSHTSVIEGSLGVLPRRIMVADDYLARARTILIAADIEMGPYG